MEDARSNVRRQRRERVGRVVLGMGMACLLLVPGLASAQAVGGTVTDTTGSVLPGVTVEVRSPALIERIRTAVTNGAGQYLIVSLEPGVYSVTFTLTGFRTVVREGIQLSTGFTATVEAQLSVGAVNETITVTAATPVVDIQNVQQRAVFDRGVIETIPTGRSAQSYALLMPGMTGGAAAGSTLSQDSGGLSAQTYQRLMIHGSQETDGMVDIGGMDLVNISYNGNAPGFIAEGNFEEMAIEYSANSASIETGGVRINLIPKEGGNRFRGALFTTFALRALQADNVDQNLRDRGLSFGSNLDKVWTVNPSFAGPIVRDRLWFFVGHTSQQANLFASNTFFNKDPSAFVYVPDRSRSVVDETLVRDQTLSLTWQATSRDKVKAFWSNNSTNKPHYLVGNTLGSIYVAPEAAMNNQSGTNVYQATWTRPQTSRLLFEAGVSHQPNGFGLTETAEAVTNLPGILDVPSLTASRNLGGWFSGQQAQHYSQYTNAFRGSVSYVTGSHNLKVGIAGTFLKQTLTGRSAANFVYLTTLAGQPLFANYRVSSAVTNEVKPNMGIYAQDQWRIDRLTVNAGVRFDYFKSGYPDHVLSPELWAPQERRFPGQTAVIWKDLQPRLGVAYDLRGDGRTALKASASRFGQRNTIGLANALNPANNNTIQQRSWVDLNGDGLPQGDPLNPAPNGELFSPTNNPAFGKPAITTFYDKDWAFGWGKRLSNWEFSGSVQHELLPRVSVDVGYFHRAFVNFSAVDNRAVGPDDFDAYSVPVPADPRLPGGGGGVVNLVDIKRNAFGRQPDSITTSANPFGGESKSWDGVDVTVDARLEGFLIRGGISTGKTSSDYCALLSQLPEGQRTYGQAGIILPTDFCHQDTNWLTQVKLLGSYTLPYGIQVAATLQSQPGPERAARVTFTNADIIPSLGRSLAGGGGVTVNVINPGTAYGDRFQQIDLRFTKVFKLGGTAQLRAMFDIFNLLNANTVTSENYALGPNYLNPLAIMPSRFGKFAFQFDF